MRFLQIIVVMLCVVFTGCSSVSEKDIYKAAIPLNLGAAYFGSIGTHEGGHGLTAWALGGRDIQIDVIPQSREGTTYLGYTTAKYNHSITPLEDTFFNVSGPGINIFAHIFTREMLKTGLLPEPIQPTIQCYSLANMIGGYGEIVFGLARLPTADLGKEQIWISGILLTSALLYDIYDLFLCDDERYLTVIGGEKFYHTQDHKKPLINLAAVPSQAGGSLYLIFDF